MTGVIIKKLTYDLRSRAGLVLIGKHLKRVNVKILIDPEFPAHSGAHNSDIFRSYLALLRLGKSDFDAIESLRVDALCMRALGLGVVQTGLTLRHHTYIHARLLKYLIIND